MGTMITNDCKRILSGQPIYASIVKAVDPHKTTAVLTIFKHSVPQIFNGEGHQGRAVAWVNTWNEYLDREWMGVRETTAAIMQDFVRNLLNAGVHRTTIDEALAKVKTHVSE